MSAGLNALRDYPIHPRGRRHLRLVERANLQKHFATRAVSVPDIRARVAPEEHDQRRAFIKARFDLPLLHTGNNDVRPERLVSEGARFANSGTDLVADHAGHANDSTPAGIRHCRR